MIDGLTNADAIPALERLMQFAGQRHRVITDNIANLSTPGYQVKDVSVAAFQEQLGAAIDRRRAQPAAGNDLPLESTREVEVDGQGIALHPETAEENLMFHDGNDRDVERVMQDLVENFLAFRTAAQFLQNRFDLINTAIRERV